MEIWYYIKVRYILDMFQSLRYNMELSGQKI